MPGSSRSRKRTFQPRRRKPRRYWRKTQACPPRRGRCASAPATTIVSAIAPPAQLEEEAGVWVVDEAPGAAVEVVGEAGVVVEPPGGGGGQEEEAGAAGAQGLEAGDGVVGV